MSGPLADVGLIGLAVMGQNLVLNLADHGFTVAVHNRSPGVTRAFLDGPAAGAAVIGCDSLEALVARLDRPRRVVLLVRAGGAVDAVLDALVPLLEPGDVVLDCGNSHWADTERRLAALAGAGVRYVGCGVSGGEEGARRGPSIMPGGDPAAWPIVSEPLRAIAARADDGEPCCDWVGEGGAGHFVKTVHNGIEYGDMQLIAEAFDLLRTGLGLDADAVAGVFDRWSRGPLESYLVSITRDIVAFRDADGAPLVDSILDSAGQKGTGRWTGIAALEAGVPLTLVAEAVFARCLSARKDERVRASEMLSGPDGRIDGDADVVVADLEHALYCSKIVSYAQGFMLLGETSRERGWNLPLATIARLWRAGCIIRSRFLDRIAEAFERDAESPCLVLDEFFRGEIAAGEAAWRRVVAHAARAGLPVPAFAAALAFYDGYRRAQLPANLLQAQRDYFGGHRYERTDRARGEWFHTDWTGRGGEVSSGSYDA